MLWCTTKADDRDVEAAERRKETALSLADAAEDQDENGFVIKLGKRNNYGIGIDQSLAISNNGSGRHQFVMFDCGFYYKGELVGTGGGIIANLYPGKTKHGSAMGLQIDKVDEVTCNVSSTL